MNHRYHVSRISDHLYTDTPLTIKSLEGCLASYNSNVSGRRKFIETDILDILSQAASQSPYITKVIDAPINNMGLVDLRYEFYEDSDNLFEWVWRNFHRRIETTPELILEILDQMFDSVITLHQLGIIHRDIKPSNFLVLGNCSEINLKLNDLELCTKIGATNNDFQEALGTEGYAPPEQRQTSLVLSQEQDQYALAMSIVYILSAAGSKYSIDCQFYSGDRFLEKIREFIPIDYGDAVLNIILKAIGPKEERYRSVLQFRCALITALVRYFREQKIEEVTQLATES